MSKHFAVSNYKGVREIELSPSGALVVIAGGNGAGKSSFIDAFVELFDPKGVRLTPKPIRAGEDEARAEYTDTDLGVRIVRTWKKDDAGKLEVFALDGAKYGKPAEVVAQLTGGLIFDPVAFLNLDERRQRDALLAKVDLPFDLDALERERAGAESRRLEAGRDVRRLEGALASMGKRPADVPAKEISPREIVDELREATAENARIDGAVEDVEMIRRRIAHLEADLVEARDAMTRASTVADLPPIDVAEIRARLDNVEASNAKIRQAARYDTLAAELDDARDAQEAAQQDLQGISATKEDGLSQAKFPVEGLSVDETGVTFDGIPFVQTNTATRLRVALAIATAGDPRLKLVIIRTGDMLDSESLAAVTQLAEERGYTVLMERDRDESREIGFVIREGVLDAPAN